MHDAFTDDPLDIREAAAEVPSVVAAIAARVDGAPVVMVATSFTVGVSYDPPLVSVAVQHSSTTWPDLRDVPVLGLSVLSDAHAPHTRQLASRDRGRRLDGIEHTDTDGGGVFIAGSHTWLECRVEATHRAGDHDIVVLRVLRLARDPEQRALVWHRPARRPARRPVVAAG
ncbi:NADH-FMN oxidoreductase RutF, flavin reductase (DIM6/NTAB) family [Curtobacterium sp. UNCCL20]|uniref:flavin reductase family protein n=1 Tax=Curtobacterium sp. UNCCL20 TaxID=1502773 RepID=UPI000883520B|nr:flavin reductase family protein [Curtobacterium sp. UNCCL20]SDQ31536.1 NADH-FMN oxidoreductase RutF, flavin reductase (DIM6/NTAB) family [Curtobacterium sp. UNCCL20]